jgi:hypothetical protein
MTLKPWKILPPIPPHEKMEKDAQMNVSHGKFSRESMEYASQIVVADALVDRLTEPKRDRHPNRRPVPCQALKTRSQ